MTLLTEKERLRAIPLVEKGLSYGEVAHMLLQKRNVGMQRPMAEEVAALFGRKLYPRREEK